MLELVLEGTRLGSDVSLSSSRLEQGNAALQFGIEVSNMNEAIGRWEPVIEPWELSFKWMTEVTTNLRRAGATGLSECLKTKIFVDSAKPLEVNMSHALLVALMRVQRTIAEFEHSKSIGIDHAVNENTHFEQPGEDGMCSAINNLTEMDIRFKNVGMHWPHLVRPGTVVTFEGGLDELGTHSDHFAKTSRNELVVRLIKVSGWWAAGVARPWKVYYQHGEWQVVGGGKLAVVARRDGACRGSRMGKCRCAGSRGLWGGQEGWGLGVGCGACCLLHASGCVESAAVGRGESRVVAEHVALGVGHLALGGGRRAVCDRWWSVGGGQWVGSRHWAVDGGSLAVGGGSWQTTLLQPFVDLISWATRRTLSTCSSGGQMLIRWIRTALVRCMRRYSTRDMPSQICY